MATVLSSWIWAFVHGSSILDFRSWVLVHSVVITKCNTEVLGQLTCIKVWQVLQSLTVITKCDRNLLQSITGVTKWNRKLLQRMTGITSYEKKLLQSVTRSYYKVWQVLQSVTVIAKWDVTACVVEVLTMYRWQKLQSSYCILIGNWIWKGYRFLRVLRKPRKFTKI